MAVREGQSAVELITITAVTGDVREGQSVLELVIGGPLPVPNCNNPPPGALHAFYSHGFTVTGGTAPYVWSISAGALPPGLSIDPATGIVSGTPTAEGIFNFTVEVIDSTPRSGFVNCSITIGGLVGISITFRGVNRFAAGQVDGGACSPSLVDESSPNLPPLPTRMK